MKNLLIFLSFIISSYCFSQRTITGTVTDPDGYEIIGVIVLVKGTDVFTETDFDGNYSIKASPEDVLVFTYPGYDAQEMILSSSNIINVTLKIDLEVIVAITNCFPYSDRFIFIKGINYDTYGFSYGNEYHLLPYNFNFNLAYSSDFKRNKNFNFGLENGVRFSNLVYIRLKAVIETADFKQLQYHSYKLQASKLFRFKSGKNIGEIQLITGYTNYDGLTSSNNLGYGLGFEKSLIYNFKVGTNFIHWQDFNEFNANASYTWRRWSIIGNYKHLAEYEEFQIGLGYNFYF